MKFTHIFFHCTIKTFGSNNYEEILTHTIKTLSMIGVCTAQVVGSNDVAASYYVGVLSRARG